MTKHPQPKPREEQAKLEIGHTEISRPVKWTLFIVGLFTLFAVPAMQTYHEIRQYATGHRAAPWPQCCDILDALPRATAAYRERDDDWISKTFRANTVLLEAIDKFEKDLKAESRLAQFVRPPTQEMLIHAGSGNEKAYVGRHGWLFYRPGIDYCTGPDFLSQRQMSRRADSGTEWQPGPQSDPLAAILQFHRQLADRNIRLVLMPTPDKATIHPEKFSSRYEGQQTSIHNPSYRQFLADLEADGVLVCDVTDVLVQSRKRLGNAAYLATDTHWRPEAMELAAEQLARFIEGRIVLDASAAGRYWHQAPMDVSNLGDIAMMLRLRRSQGVFDEEVVTIRPVLDETAMPWRPDPAAEVLLLGDSFANIYSLEMMNWGCAAGLAEQLGVSLNRPVDTILLNDHGAYATRKALSHELAQGNDRLDGKKVVVWQFAVRELAVGDWKLLGMTVKQLKSRQEGLATPVRELIVSGTIAAKSAAPRAGQIPYAHHVFTIDLTNLQVHKGSLADSKIAVYLFSMRNRQNTPAFLWPVGKRVKLKLHPWRPELFARYGRINRSETKDTELRSPWWGEVAQ